jgi:hypothetical protein
MYEKEHGEGLEPPQGRRRHFTDEEVAALKQQLLESIYADIGKSLVKKVLWVGGACIFALFAWLVGKGHINIG